MNKFPIHTRVIVDNEYSEFHGAVGTVVAHRPDGAIITFGDGNLYFANVELRKLPTKAIAIYVIYPENGRLVYDKDARRWDMYKTKITKEEEEE